ncbi:MAG: hypothetical protein KJ666_08900 [Bacteroidetes bacterium]|nr:hypothetical protein [Bacteroidota bacterium]
MIRIIILISLFFFVRVENSNCQIVEQRGEDTTESISGKSPWGAVVRSALLPGLGQIYNESYWKAPIVWGVSGWFIYNWINNNNLYRDYRDQYLQSVSTGSENSLYKSLREFYRDQRDLFAIYLGLTYFLNLVDAYVDAQLFSFDVEGLNNEVRLNFRINLK